MKHIKTLFFASIIIAGLTSCEDFFIQDLEIPRQDLDQQLVVHGFVSDIDSSIEFKVARNFGLDDLSSLEESIVNNANIKIYSGEQLLHEITQNPDSSYRLDLGQSFGFSNEPYRVEVTHPDFETAIIETNMPSYVMPDKLTFKEDGGFSDPNGVNDLDIIQITFTDPAGEDNYYEFQIHQILLDYEEIIFGEDTFRIETRYPENYFTPDGNFEQGISGFMMTDDLIDGQEYTLQIMLNGADDVKDIPIDKLRVSWNCISKDHYEYSKTLLRYNQSAGFGLFSDPIAVYSNVDNGLGTVSFRSSRVFELEEQ